ncbi:MAG: SAM-dependent methyltransferase [marine bacterium B5-7]|nr:MAG: SAM-dependent methyltransferase [marine bacterium B5-7]
MNSKYTKTLSLREKFSSWFNGPLGRAVYSAEIEQLEDILPGLFGYHILQYGYSAASNYLAASRITNKTILFLDNTELNNAVTSIRTSAEELPIAVDSIDVIVLPHILEYSKDAHKLLREMERVLIDDGHVVIIGINPLSLWGLWHLFKCWWGEMPWSGQLISIPRLKDWLSLLDFEVEKTNSFFFSPPLSNQNLLKKFMPLERLGRYCWPVFGGLYVVVAKKRTVPLNPIKMQWRAKRNMIGSGVIEPTTRNR